MRTLLALAALFTCLPLVRGQEMFNQDEILARQFAASTGQPYELCLKALQVAAWCQANPQGGVANGETYDAEATALQLAEAMKILKSRPAAPAPASAPASGTSVVKPTIVTSASGTPIGADSLASRPAVKVGRSANDPQRMAEQKARLLRQNDYQLVSGAPRVNAARIVLTGAFTGFTGNGVYTLANGQVWQQVDGVVTHHNPAIMNPTAVLTVNADGTYGILELSGVPGTVLLQFMR